MAYPAMSSASARSTLATPSCCKSSAWAVASKLGLKIGALVRLTQSMSAELPVGAVGTVTAWDTHSGDPVVRFLARAGTAGAQLRIPKKQFVVQVGKDTATRLQIPLRLAWAVSIHVTAAAA